MSKLVELKKGEICTTSLKFAEEFCINHTHVLEKIRKLTIEYPMVKNQFIEDTFTNDRNRDYTFFWMTRDGYLTLIMNTGARGKSVKLLFEKKQLFIQAFNEMEKLILKKQTNENNLEWKKTREQGKNIRLELTDQIKDFVDYATKQGSKNANMYYSNITKMQYKALDLLQQKSPKIRDTLDLLELNQLLLAENIAKKTIKKCMVEQMHYKEIYLLTKQAVENFAKVVMICGERSGE